jgi:predicted RNase H-like HicB family nuclease
MTVDDYKTILYRQDDGCWVAEIPAIPGCYALMPTREAALAELNRVFALIAGEYRSGLARRGLAAPAASSRKSSRRFPTFEVPSDAPMIPASRIERALDEMEGGL